MLSPPTPPRGAIERPHHDAPRVTVLMPVRNVAPFLDTAVESVLRQTFPDFEFVIVDDGSSDRSAAIAAGFHDPRIRVVRNATSLGLARSLNRGLAMSRGEYVARFDGDDVCAPERLAAQVAYLDAHPGVAAVGAQAAMIDVDGRRIWWASQRVPTTDLGVRWCQMFETPVIHGAAMFRRAVVQDELGGYDESFRVGEDADLWRRLARRHAIVNLPDSLVARRVHPWSTSSDRARGLHDDYIERKTAILHAEARAALGWDDLPLRWMALWMQANDDRVRMTPPDLAELADAIERCAARFAGIHPAAAADADVAWHQASMLRRALWKAAISARRLSLRIWWRACRRDARTACAALPRVAVFWLAGDAPMWWWRRAQRLRAVRRRRACAT